MINASVVSRLQYQKRIRICARIFFWSCRKKKDGVIIKKSKSHKNFGLQMKYVVHQGFVKVLFVTFLCLVTNSTKLFIYPSLYFIMRHHHGNVFFEIASLSSKAFFFILKHGKKCRFTLSFVIFQQKSFFWYFLIE